MPTTLQTAQADSAGAEQDSPRAGLDRLDVPAPEKQQDLYAAVALTETERHELLELGDGGPPAQCGSEAASLYELVAAQARRSPEACAVVEPRASITYRELVERANGLGWLLSERGIGPEMRVGILADRSIESITGVLGVLAAGAAYVPLDAAVPEERLAYVLEDAAVTMLVTPAALAEQAKGIARRVPSGLEVMVIEDAPSRKAPPDSGVNATNAAYVIYTSGSTGTPKGVTVEHGGAMNLIQGFKAVHDFAAHRLLMIPPLAFDASVGDVFPVLSAGGTLVLHAAPAELGIRELDRFCGELGVTAIDAPVGLWRRWVDGIAAGTGNEAALAGVTLMMIGGESVPVEQIRLFGRLTGKRVLLTNHYGPTEASVCATVLSTRDGLEFNAGDLPIGRPLPGVRVYVLDADMQLVERGKEGELFIGGAGVAHGYLNRPELTAERFVRDPFHTAPEARMYRTGDLARWNTDGTLQFLGRVDHQVKIRGFRIELGEIESRLAAHDRVREAVVIAREDTAGDKRLVAYFVANIRAESGPDAEELRAHLSGLLPEYMVPAAYVRLEAMPLTTNGKLDRKALPSPDTDAYVTRDYEEPVGAVETALAAIWVDVLKVRRVGRNDNFFELGGHSLLAVTLIERMRQAGVTVDVRALFASPTLRGLAEAAGGPSHTVVVPPNLIPAGCTAIMPEMLTLVDLTQSEIDGIVELVPGGAANVQDIYPLAPLQEGILFHHLLGQKGDVYLAPTMFSIESREHVDKYLAALQTIVDRHDILRTGVVWDGLEEPVQVVWRTAPLHVEEVLLDGVTGDIAEQLRERFDPRHYRIDVRKAPLWRLFIAEDKRNGRWVILELMHHLVGDHVTLQVMQQEIGKVLRGEIDRLAPPLPFRNFVAQTRLGVSREEHETFFAQMLSDVDEATAPFGVTDVLGDGSEVVEASSSIEIGLCRRLRAEARALGVTAASICHLALAMVLGRTAGRDDVVFGTVMFGRMQGGEGADRAMGIFINTLPIRIRVGEEGARASVRTTHELLMQLLRREHAPLTLAQRASGVRAPAPLFTSLLNYRYVGDGEAVLVRDAVSLADGAGDGGSRMLLLGGEERSNYPFDVSINDHGERLSLDVQTSGAIDPQRVCAMIEAALESLVAALEYSPAEPVCHLNILPAGESRKLLAEWNDTAAQYRDDKCIHELFEEHVARTPQAVAVVEAKRRLTYLELNRHANRVARHLRKLGVKPDDRVALCAERGLEMVTGILGILKAGGAYLPVDPAYPADRREHMLRDAGAKAVVTQERMRRMFAEAAFPVLALEDFLTGAQDEPDEDPESIGLRPKNLAYVIYTSGSTGKPKGVMVEHGSLCNQVAALQARYQLNARDRVLQFASFTFDMSVEEIFGALCSGAALVLRTDEWLASAEAFWKLVKANGVTVANLPSIYWQQLIMSGESEIPACLRQIMIGGDAVRPEAMTAWLARKGYRPRLFNAYGPTETTVNAAIHEVIQEQMSPHSIGKPVANTRVYILDAHAELAPIGVPGELYIGGAGVARGYLNRPELTAERFVRDPFAGNAEARLYRTGDLGRWLTDGSIEYLGRNDQQVKIRGFRIELGEIEMRLAEHPAVREAVVLARQDAHDDRRLVAYLVAAEGADGADAEALRAHLTAVLPDHMVPAAYVWITSFPVTQNGKLDRAALPAPEAGAYATRGYEAPADETEMAVASVWADVLKLERVGRNDNFFELGGHSLLAVTMVSRLRSSLGIEVGIRELFAHPELAAFSGVVKTLARAEQSHIEQVSRAAALPLSFAQQRLWFLAQVEGASEAYHIPMGLHVSGKLDRDALKSALDRIVFRHEALRTTFHLQSGQPGQRFASTDAGFALTECDLSGHPDAAGEAERRIQQEAAQRFDLERGPLVRGQLIRMASQEHLLLVTMHHIVSDGWSMGVLADELSALYQAYCAESEDPLPRLEIQYADYAVWQRQRLTGEMLERQIAYWRNTLKGAPTLLELPTDRPRPAQQDYAGGAVKVEIDAELTSRLRAAGQRRGMTVYMLMVAAWSAVLARLAGQEEVVIGTATANRTTPEIEKLIGFFVNTLALRVELTGTVGELLERVKIRTLEAQEHQDLPFEQVVEVVRPPRSLAITPIFQVMLIWQSNDEGTLYLPGLQLRPAQVSYGVAKFDLELDLGEVGDRIVGDLRYATALFDRRTIVRHAGYLREALEAIAGDEQRQVERIGLMSVDERRQVTETWNERRWWFEKNRCIHDLFEEQAASVPNAIAVTCEGRSLSYAELDRKANRLARHLRKLGVGPDDLVALCMERSEKMIVAVLAVLKAGGAYVPLDPAYPAERLEYMLADSRPIALLVHLTEGTREALSDVLKKNSIPLVDLQSEAALWAHEPETRPTAGSVGLKPHHLAYVIYTSGSTGKPKGVMVEHTNIVRLLTATENWFHFDHNDVWTLFHSYAFDFSVWEIWGALAHGGRLVIVPHATARSPHEFYKLLCAENVTILNQTPGAFRQLIAAQGADETAHRLRHVIFGGEALEVSTLRPWYQRAINEQTQLINMYGITETTVHVTYRALEKADTALTGPSPIGVRIPDLTIYVLDAHGDPVPIGVTGELYVGGAGVARGYLNRPELTDERFVEDRFSGERRARLYKTGDLARWLPDGALEYLGRNDHQVKIRGFRIELGEIESRLADHDRVREAVVIAREDTAGDKRLVAYFVANIRDESGPDAEELRAHLSGLLPEYMVPAAYVRLESMPLTTNGKLDRKALPAPETDAYVTRDYEEPVGAVETALAAIWIDALKVQRVGRNDNFFELGGHSLLAVTLIERMRQTGVTVDVRALFASPTLRGLAEAAGGESRAVVVPPNLIPAGCTAITPEMLTLVDLTQGEIDGIVELVPGGAANVQDIYPLAPLQEGILFHHLLGHKGDVYLTVTMLAAESRQRLDRYAEALQKVIDRHDILRTAVVWDGLREPVQVVWRNASLHTEEVKFDAAQGDIAKQLRARFNPLYYRIDVRKAPLWRLFIAEDKPNQRWVMLELAHHLVDDNTSVRFLLNEVRAILSGESDRLPEPLPFRNFVAQARLGVTREEHEAFFRRMLGDVEEPTAPFGLTDVQGDGSQIREGRREVDAELARRLRMQARSLGVTAASLCHLAWAMVVAKTSGRDDVLFGTVMFGRMQGSEGADRTMGIFINTLPVRIRVGDESVRGCVRATHELLTEMFRHEHAPLTLAQRVSGVRAPLPLFTSLLNYRYILDEALSAEQGFGAPQSLVGLEFLGGQEYTNYPFSLSVNDLGEGFSLDVQVDGSLDPDRVCAMMHTAMESLVMALEVDPGAAVCRLAVLSSLERVEELEGWNDTGRALPALGVHEVFAAVARRSPDAEAVVSGGGVLSYAQLDAWACLLAGRLRDLGVRAGDRVAVELGRSPALVAAELAVLKCGAAYVPVDVSWPAERRALLIEDCAAAAVMCAAGTAGHAGPSAVVRLEVAGSETGPETETGGREPFADAAVDPDAPACVMYTSGSTGRPRGVVVPHRGIVRLTVDNGYLEPEPGDRVAFAANPAFDASTFEVWAPLLNGAATVVVEQDEVLDPRRFARALDRHRVNVLWMTVGLYNQFADRIGDALGRLKCLIVGGDALDPRVIARTLERNPPARLLNGYGPTETTTFATTYEIRAVAPGAAAIPIGYPIGNTRVYLLDAHREPVPAGVAGEIYIGGAGVALGYLNQPGLSAERFMPDPFSPEPGARMYRSGDLGRRMADGSIAFLGRNDFQVKLRGFRIEPTEIEAHLAGLPGIGEALVMLREDDPGDRHLVAYYTDAAGQPAADAETLRARLLARLPDYMVPAAWVRIAAFPLTASGKIDRKALPAPDRAAYAARAYQDPEGPVERAVAGVWAELLHLERVGRNDNFFALGGHSLLAVRAAARLAAALHRQVEIRDIFAHPVLYQLAASLDHNTTEQRGPANTASNGALLIRKGTQTPIFLLHDGYGDQLYFSALAQHLPKAWPVYGLPSVPHGEQELHTMSAMAERMIGLLRRVQAHGPYRLGGWSFGGVLAYEVAQQLISSGQDVEFLGLMDSWCPDGKDAGLRRKRTIESVLMELCKSPRIEDLRETGIAFEEMFARFRASGALPANFVGLSAQETREQCRNLVMHLGAMESYRPRAITIPVHLFAANERPAERSAETRALGWERYVPEELLYIYAVPGNHLSMMRPPHIGELGRRIEESMVAATDVRV